MFTKKCFLHIVYFRETMLTTIITTRQVLKLPTMGPMFDLFFFRSVVSTLTCSSTSSSLL